jgi:LysM repeat protein
VRRSREWDAGHTHTTETGGTAPPDANSEFSYIWFDGAREATESYQPNSTTSWSSFLVYDTCQNLVEANIDDGQARDVFYADNMLGEIVQRDTGYEGGGGGHTNISGPHARYYYFGGIEMGDVSNDGTSNVNYATAITDHKTKPGTGLFQNGATTETKYADFDASYDPINGLTYDSTPGSYTVQGGDTLQSIAQQIWGDANFWYLIADANGLDNSSTLVAGQQLIIPNKVADNQNNSSTYKVYDPNDAIGDVSPTTPPKPQPHHNNCGIFGAILMAIVAVVVTAVIPGFGAALEPMLTGLGIGADTAAAIGAGISDVVIAAAADAAGQVVGLAVGAIKSFNWKELALSAISAGVNFGVGEGGLDLFGGLSDVVDPDVIAGLQGATANAITQGIGVATGLQKSFNWGGVAAAGVSAGVSEDVGQWAETQDFSSNPIVDNAIGVGLKGMAGLIAGAATRSLITGTDFGDNILNGLPDVIGQTVGGAMEEQVQQQNQVAPPTPDPNPAPFTAVSSVGVTGSSTDGPIQPVVITPEVTLAATEYNLLKQQFGNVMTPLDEYNELRARGIVANINADNTHVAVLEDSNGIPYRDGMTPDTNAKLVDVDFASFYQALLYDTAGGSQAAATVQYFFNKQIPIIPEEGTPDNNSKTGVPYHGTFFDPGEVPSPTGDLNAHDPAGELDAVFFNPDAAAELANDHGYTNGGFISPALTLLHEIDHAVGFSISPLGEWKMHQSLEHTSGPLANRFNNLEEQRVEVGVSVSDANALMTFNQMSPEEIADADVILNQFPEGNGLEKDTATILGEPVRENHLGRLEIVGSPTVFKWP